MTKEMDLGIAAMRLIQTYAFPIKMKYPLLANIGQEGDGFIILRMGYLF